MAKRAGIARRAQAEIQFIQYPLGGRGAHGGDQTLDETDEILLRIKRLVPVGGFRILVMVVEEYQVEIGPGRQVLAAEAAHPQYADPASLDVSVAVFEFMANDPDQLTQNRLGKAGIGETCLAGIDGPVDQTNADQEFLLGRKNPGLIEFFLIGRSALQGERKAVSVSSLLIRNAGCERGINQAVKNMRLAGDDIGKARRRSKDQGDQANQIGVGFQDGEKLNSGRQSAEKPVKGEKMPDPDWTFRKTPPEESALFPSAFHGREPCGPRYSVRNASP